MVALISCASSLYMARTPLLPFMHNSNSKSYLIRPPSTPHKTLSPRCSSQPQPQPQPQGRWSTLEFERLFSNLNQATMKREPGSITSGVFLVAGTTVGAGVLAIPAVTQEAGFLASAITCILCGVYMVVTGLLIAEVNVNTMCELGSGGVSLVSMAMRTIGKLGVQIAWTSIVLGTAIPLILFLIWDAVILGTIPSLSSTDQLTDPLEQLRSNNGIVGPIVEVFSFLAISTSYIGFVLGLSDFVSDLLQLPSSQSKPLPYLLTLLPPLVLSLLDPEIFFKALDFAGTYGVLVLFGVLPAAMSWSERYSDASQSPKLQPLVPGGKLTLSLVMGGALLVILSELLENAVHL